MVCEHFLPFSGSRGSPLGYNRYLVDLSEAVSISSCLFVPFCKWRMSLGAPATYKSLHKAAAYGFEKQLQELHEEGLLPDEPDEYGMTRECALVVV